MTLHELIRQDRTSVIPQKTGLREGIEASVAEFLANGGEIETIEFGCTALNADGQKISMKDYWGKKTDAEKELKAMAEK